MSQPYDPKMITPSVYGDRRPVETEIVAILSVTFTDRRMKLIDSQSRAVKRNEVHELMITDQEPAPGGELTRMSAVAFFEALNSGLIVSGDAVTVNGAPLGALAGYDMNHMPNHMNVVVRAGTLTPPELKVGDRLLFRRG